MPSTWPCTRYHVELLAVGGVNQLQPVAQHLFGRRIFRAQAAHQLRRQQDLFTTGQQFPPAGAEQALQGFNPFQLLVMALLTQAAEQWCGEGGGEVQPVALADVGVATVEPAQQPGGDALAIAVGHQQAFGIAKYTVQARVFAAALESFEAQWGVAVEAVQAGAEALARLPELGGVMGAVAAIDQPVLVLLVEQDHGHARDAPTLGEAAQVLTEDLGQARQAAHPQLLAHLAGELMVLFALLGQLPTGQQVADICQAQEPAIGVRLDPATGVQDAVAGALEVQVHAMALPVGGCAFDA